MNKVYLDPVLKQKEKRQFNVWLNQLHYAKSRNVIGRDVKFWAKMNGITVGGIELSSPLPRIYCRDSFLGLHNFYGKKEYWIFLNQIVEMSRAFILPQYQNCGLGTCIMNLFEYQAIPYFERYYDCEIFAMYVLANHSNSKLFLNNDWIYVGQTKGHCSKGIPKDYRKGMSIRGYRLPEGGVKWHVYVKKIKEPPWRIEAERYLNDVLRKISIECIKSEILETYNTIKDPSIKLNFIKDMRDIWI